ncbi:lysosomal alpha-glucosidase-like [Schistocerca piceifrons]|uniref:lysosomal alpha-glucosidase-like n=1 Tax=Schistocerca piceifrons TaxID=274613 RepID=UPI001F5EB47C|nr:lysosomal alpha-glucosidase-like [Schistocerca piceifrons]
MQGLLKNFFRKFRGKQNIETRAICQTDQDTGFCRESAADFNKCGNDTLPTESHAEGHSRKCDLSNCAVYFVFMLLFGIFVIVPAVYLLHCFDILNSKTPAYVDIPIRGYQPHRAQTLHPKSRPKNLPDPPAPSVSQCSVENSLKFDCYPEDGSNEEGCRKRGCCWKSVSDRNINETRISLGIPYCFYPQNYGSYKIINSSETQTGGVVFLQRMFRSPYPNDVPVLRIDVKHWKENKLRIKVSDPNNIRYEPPVPEVPAEELLSVEPNYRLQFNGATIDVLHKWTNRTLLKFGINTLTFADQFLQASMLLPGGSSMYGLGEHRSSLKLSTDWQRFTMFNHDRMPLENKNLYGSHPFFLLLDENNNSSGVFLLNSNAMEVILQPTPAVTFRTIGGILDFFVFMGPSPAEVVQQYQDIVGYPAMPPYWGLGFHLCRFGYKTLNYTKEILKKTQAAGIPIDVQWLDLDYMNDSNDFTYDKERFAGLPKFVEELHEANMHFVPLIDPGISAGQVPGTYAPYDMGLQMGIFVKNSSGKPFVGKVWNRVSTVWPDFTNPMTTTYWLKQLQNMHDLFPYDGAWIDMNEPSNFYSGTAAGCPLNNLDYPPYLPVLEGGNLFYHTLCMSAKQYYGNHYNLHNLYGLTEAIATNFALAEIRGKRPFIISRSTFSGIGHFAGHWSGDNLSGWYEMKKSISELLSFSLFGIPLMGSDICGFNGNTTVSLCQRWSQLGAFYPFSRNHNTDDGIPQDPVSLGPAVVESARKALLTRYRLLPYLYTLFWRAHAFGDTVARPLFFEFVQDAATHSLDEQFLWGSSLMIVPVLEEGATTVDAYLPAALWYDSHTLTSVESSGKWYTFNAPLDTIPIFIRGGSILPTQAPNMTTIDSRKNDFELIVAADEDGHAEGSLYWDDGDSMNTYESGQYTLLNFTLDTSVLSSNVVHYGYHTPMILDGVLIMGVPGPVNTVIISDEKWPFSYDTTNKCLLIKDMKISLHKNFSVHWS